MSRHVDHRRGLGRELGLVGVGIGLEQDVVILGEDLVLVPGAGTDLGQEQLPDPARSHRAHRVQPAVPRVEVADDAHRHGRRRPHRERGAGHALVRDHVRAEVLVELLVAALADQVQVQLADRPGG